MPGRIGAGSTVLQVITGIMPSSYHIHIGTVFPRTIQCISIMGMATVIQGRIETCSLLAHVAQTKISTAFVNRIINAEVGRYNITRTQKINTLCFE